MCHNTYNAHQVKAEYQRLTGLLQSLLIPEWKWVHITMDFVMGLPNSPREYKAIWVIVDRLTKSVYLLLVKTTYSLSKYANLYIAEILRLHGTPISIVSDRDSRFKRTANFGTRDVQLTINKIKVIQ